MRSQGQLVAFAGGFLVLLAAGVALPNWALFLLTVALAKGLAILGLVLLMRAGLVSFGQGLYYALGAYTAGALGRLFAAQDAFVIVLAGAVMATAIAALVGLLMVQYREIFFAMLSLAFSMLFYGLLVKNEALGGTDGFNIARPTFLGFEPEGTGLRFMLYGLTLAVCGVTAYLSHRAVLSTLGYLGLAIRDNEVRVEYLGASVRRAVYAKYLMAGGMAGASGALVALAVGHVDPQAAYWTTSGEFVFVALLGGTGNVLAPILGSVLFEFARSYAYEYSPYTWQMALGIVMLMVILFLPRGLWSLSELWPTGRSA